MLTIDCWIRRCANPFPFHQDIPDLLCAHRTDPSGHHFRQHSVPADAHPSQAADYRHVNEPYVIGRGYGGSGATATARAETTEAAAPAQKNTHLVATFYFSDEW